MTTKTQASTKYYIYIDECGDQNLENYNPEFPIFTLCGILVSREHRKKLDADFNELKMEFWGNEDIIIHSREIRRCKNEFINLLDKDVKTRFYERINTILSQNNAYVVVACSILRARSLKFRGRRGRSLEADSVAC